MIRSGPEEAVAVLRGVRKRYADSGREVLTGVELEIHPGELVSVMGESGAGKSTLLNILGCVDGPTGGEYRLTGRSVESLGERELAQLRARTIGFVFQHYHLIDYLTVRQNLEVRFLYGPGASPADQDRRVTEVLAGLGLTDLADRRPRRLSGGEMQRVAIARALVGQPKMLLADEPTGNLDEDHSWGVFELLTRVAAGGTAVILVTHDPALAGRCGRRLTLRDGRLVDAG